MQEESQGRYLIQIGDDMVLDCRAEATARPPLCYASNANQAQGLLLHGRILTINHNNAAVELTQAADGSWIATLYAVVRILATHDIMWSYGEEFAEGFDQSTLSTISSDVPSDDEEEGEKRDTSVSISSDSEMPVQHEGGLARHRRVIARLEGAGFDGRDTFPEWAFDINDTSTVSSGGNVDNTDNVDNTAESKRDV